MNLTTGAASTAASRAARLSSSTSSFDELEVFFEKVTEKVLYLVFRDTVVPLQMLP